MGLFWPVDVLLALCNKSDTFWSPQLAPGSPCVVILGARIACRDPILEQNGTQIGTHIADVPYGHQPNIFMCQHLLSAASILMQIMHLISFWDRTESPPEGKSFSTPTTLDKINLTGTISWNRRRSGGGLFNVGFRDRRRSGVGLFNVDLKPPTEKHRKALSISLAHDLVLNIGGPRLVRLQFQPQH